MNEGMNQSVKQGVQYYRIREKRNKKHVVSLGRGGRASSAFNLKRRKNTSLQILVGSTMMLAIYISLRETLQIAVLLLKISEALFSFKHT